MQAEADAELAKEGLVSSLTTKLSQVKAENLETRNEIEQKRLEADEASPSRRASPSSRPRWTGCARSSRCGAAR